LNGAIAEYREALRLKPTDADTHYFLGIALERNDDAQGALNEVRRALKLQPNDPD